MTSRTTEPASREGRAHLQRTKSVGFRVRQQEYEELLRAAETAGMPVGEWIREVSFRAARGGNSAKSEVDLLPGMMRIGLEELAALRALVLSLFGSTNPNLTKEQIDQVLAYAESVKRQRAEDLINGTRQKESSAHSAS